MGLFTMIDHYMDLPELQDDTTVSVELHTLSLTNEWLYDGLIFRTTLYDNSRHTVDQYANRWLEIIGSAPVTQTLYFVVDISKIVFTVYGRSRSQELTRFRRDIKGYVAIVEKDTLESQFSRMLVSTMDRETSNVHLGIFNTMDDALAWLMEMAHLTQTTAE